MSDHEEDLRVWLIELSHMTDGDLPEDAPLEEALAWLGARPDSEFDDLRAVAKNDATLREFLALGQTLMQLGVQR